MDLLTAAVTVITQGWPLAAIVVALVFRKDLASLLPRVRKAGPLELDAQDQRQALSEAKLDNVPKQLPGVASTPAIEASERHVRSILDQLPQKEWVDRLARALAEASLSIEFERTYRTIFGSQIAALKSMNGPHVTSSQALRSFYDAAVKNFPEAYSNYSFEDWARYLLISGVAINDNENWRVTDKGLDFLRYMLNTGLLENKDL